jgi:hypothetical protein
MDKRTLRRTVITIGLILVSLISLCVITAYFLFGANLDQVRISEYIIPTRVGDHYEFSLDTDRIIWEHHLPNPPASLLKNYPEIEAIKSLNIYAERIDNGYSFETVSTSNDQSLAKALRKAGIVLKGTKWTWTENEIISKNASHLNSGFTELSLPDYTRVSLQADGSYSVQVDHDALLSDCSFTLPLNPTDHTGYQAVMSLSIGVSQDSSGYRMQAQSSMPTIMEALAENHVRITNTAWTWTAAEMAAHAGTLASSAEQTSSVQNPTQQEVQTSPSPTSSPAPREAVGEPITSLYGFDQTAVRIAIRNAKESYYGSKLESGSVYMNYFAVGNENTEHKNIFRIVYQIATSGGTEYLIADVYDLDSETGYSPSDVHLRTAATRSEARSTDDIKDYTLYTLTEGSMVFPENAGKSPFDSNGFVKEQSISVPLTYDELWDIPQTDSLTLLQLLAFARNEMFARAGHQYNTSGSYYQHFSSYSWYDPVGTVTAGELAEKWPITSSNTATIKFLEKLIKEG